MVAAVVAFCAEALVRTEPVNGIAHARLAGEVGRERRFVN